MVGKYRDLLVEEDYCEIGGQAEADVLRHKNKINTSTLFRFVVKTYSIFTLFNVEYRLVLIVVFSHLQRLRKKVQQESSKVW